MNEQASECIASLVEAVGLGKWFEDETGILRMGPKEEAERSRIRAATESGSQE